jgi:urease subunit alpha
VASCWKLASKMRDERGPMAGEPFGNADNARILRYLAKITINPAITFGIADHVGSLEPGKMADFVVWQPAFFGIKPLMVFKAGMLVWGVAGDAAASLGMLEPNLMRSSWGAEGSAPNALSAAFVHPAAIDDDIAGRFNIAKPLLPLSGTRALSKRDMRLNDTLPDIRVDNQTFDVYVDGVCATSAPAREVKLNKLYMLR